MFRSDELKPSRVAATLRADGWKIVLGAFAPLAGFALLHMVTVFPLSWVVLFTREDAGHFLIVEIAGAVVNIAAIAASGLFADRYSRRSVLGVSAAVIAVYSGFAPQLLNMGEIGAAVFIIVGFALLGFLFGQSTSAVTSSFSPQSRYTGSAFTSDLAWLFGAGFAPLVALPLAARLGLIAAGFYSLSGGSLR